MKRGRKMLTEELRQRIWGKLPDLWNKKFELSILYEDLERKIRSNEDDDLKRIHIIKAFKIRQQIEVLERAINLISWCL